MSIAAKAEHFGEARIVLLCPFMHKPLLNKIYS